MPKETSDEETLVGTGGTVALNNARGGGNAPLCRCRVLYIGSAVPTITKDGLQGIQQPLKERYPANESTETKGIDAWLSVWSNGLLLEYVDGTKRTESAFFPIVTLHYCAAVRYVNVSGFAIEGGGERFIPLDTPFAHIPNSPHPPIFAAIFRRTSGIKVLECHAFICTNERAANALVRCCFHSYADTIYLKMDDKMAGVALKAIKEGSSRSATPTSELNLSEQENSTAIDEMREESNWNERAIGQKTWQRRQQNGEYDSSSLASSLYKSRKSTTVNANTVAKKRESSVFDNGGAIIPYMDNGRGYARRSGSHPDVRDPYYSTNADYGTGLYERGTPLGFAPLGTRSGPGFPPPGLMFGGYFAPLPPPGFPAPGGIPPPPQSGTAKVKPGKRSKHAKNAPPTAFIGPPPPGGAPHLLPPPPHMMMAPPPFRHPFPPMSPLGRFGMPRPPAPHLMPPPRFYFTAGPPPFGSPAHFAWMERAQQAAALAAAANAAADCGAPAGSGPIITESIYDTFPRNRITPNHAATYEEPVYMPSHYGHHGPHHDPTLSSSYKPGSISPENYETFYETYRRRKSTAARKNGSGSDSDASGEGSQTDDAHFRPAHPNNRFWEAYEASVYRKTHINEKAFANTVNGTSTDRNNNNSARQEGKERRPNTPPADYDYDGAAETPTPNQRGEHIGAAHGSRVGGVSAY